MTDLRATATLKRNRKPGIPIDALKTVRVEPGEIVVFEITGDFSEEILAKMYAAAKHAFPDNQVMFCAPGVKLKGVLKPIDGSKEESHGS